MDAHGTSDSAVERRRSGARCCQPPSSARQKKSVSQCCHSADKAAVPLIVTKVGRRNLRACPRRRLRSRSVAAQAVPNQTLKPAKKVERQGCWYDPIFLKRMTHGSPLKGCRLDSTIPQNTLTCHRWARRADQLSSRAPLIKRARAKARFSRITGLSQTNCRERRRSS